MHFGTHMYSVLSLDGVLTVVSPYDLPMVSGWAVCAFIVFVAFYFMHAKLRSFVLVSLILLAALGLVTANGTIVLDAVHGTAVVHTVTFFYPHTYRYPLSSVSGASVASSDQSDALRLIFQGGSDVQLTPYDQMGGKGEAAFAINQFLREHGGTGSPY
jgi:hypothetical protein